MPERSELELPDGVRLHVETHGPADAGVTVVLLHGWCLDRRTWHHQVRTLREQGDVRIVAYDARGHGRSGATRLRSATLGQLAADLAEVLRAYAGDTPVVLGGHSMGGMTIMEYAYAHPDEFTDRVAGLLFASTTAEGATHTRYGLPLPVSRLFRVAEMAGAGVLARCGAWHPHQAVLPALQPVVRWLLFGDAFEPGDLQVTMSAFSRASLRSIGGFRNSIGEQQRLETLTALGHVPAAVLVGDRDRLTPPPCAKSIAGALPGTELTVLPGAGHMLILERPAEVSAALAALASRAAGCRRDGEAVDDSFDEAVEPDPGQTGYEQAA